MTRINADIRDSIVANAIEKSGITAEFERLKKRRADWAEAVRVESLGGQEARAKINKAYALAEKHYAKIPDNIKSHGSLLRTDYDIYVNVAGASICAQFSGELTDVSKNRVMKVAPHRHTLKADNPLVDEFHAIEKLAGELKEKRETIRANVDATVRKFTTIKKLLEAWPEAKELLPSDIGTAKAQLPAVQAADLNNMIGLPTDKKDAA